MRNFNSRKLEKLLLISKTLAPLPQVYLEHCQRSMMELFAKMLIIGAKHSIVHVLDGPKYASNSSFICCKGIIRFILPCITSLRNTRIEELLPISGIFNASVTVPN